MEQSHNLKHKYVVPDGDKGGDGCVGRGLSEETWIPFAAVINLLLATLFGSAKGVATLVSAPLTSGVMMESLGRGEMRRVPPC